MSRLLEICCTSLADARAAQRGGADRIELCEELWMGGVTPDEELIASVVKAVSPPVFVLVRPRGGDFVFDSEDVRDMVQSIAIARQLGVAGIVCGALTGAGGIDLEATRHLIKAARPLPFTFHRAFDDCIDQLAALQQLRELGAERILTSAGQIRASDDPERLRQLALAAGESPRILACGGVRSANIGALAQVAELEEFHSAASVGARGGVDEEEVRALKAALAAR